jgi:hypothetical protein
MDRYINATKLIASIDESLDSMRKEDGKLPDTEDVDELLRFRSELEAAPEAPIRDYRPENAPFVTANGKPVGLLKSIRPDITEIVISTSYCGCEFVNGELASVEILKEPLDKWEERYGKAIDDSKVQ